VGFGKLAQSSLSYLWGVNAMVLFQYLTDLYDGAVGRHRNTGLVKWGFFMDHFLDFLFLCSLCFCGYLITPPELSHWILILTIVLSGYLIVSFLSFSCTNKFEIYHFNFGPTEFRAVVILLNTLIIFTGTHHFKYSLPSAVALLAVGLLIYVWRTSKTLWQLDMETKLQAV